MHFKRNETFRYTFGQPLSAIFNILSINNHNVTSKSGTAEVLDISPEGLRISSKLNIPDIPPNKIIISITFKLNEKDFTVNGLIVWKKEWGTQTTYGISLIEEGEEKQTIIEQLKIYSKNNRNIDEK